MLINLRNVEAELLATCMVAMVLLHPSPVLSDDIELSMPNDAGGHIYLTRDACDSKTSAPDAASLHRVYSVALEGTDGEQRYEGCWMSPDINIGEIPAEYLDKAQRVVIIYADNGMQFSQLLSDFMPNTPGTGTMLGQF